MRGRVIESRGVATGVWLVQATAEGNADLSGQGAGDHIAGWFWWTEWLTECWVNPHGQYAPDHSSGTR